MADVLLEDDVRTALEVGAGTGKATRVVAARGVRIVAVEPDHDMAALLSRSTAGLPVEVAHTTFEGLDPRPPVDLLFSAAAWHWTDPATRWSRAAAALRPGGRFATVGGPVDLTDDALRERVEQVRYDAFGSEDVAGSGTTRWPREELEASPYFTDVHEVDLATSYEMSADDFVGLLSTVSIYLVAEHELREDVLARVRGLLPDRFEVRRDLRLTLARRTD